VVNPEVPGEFKSVYFFKQNEYDRGFEEAFVRGFNASFPEQYVKVYMKLMAVAEGTP
jgi:hypothetical protein